MEIYNRENVPFQAVLDALSDVERPFPPVYLHRFSDISHTDLGDLKIIWGQLPVERRRALLEDLERLTEADTLVSFDDLARYVLQDEDPMVRILAIHLLWDVEDPHLAPTFIQMMETDPDHQVRAAAANALGQFIYLGELEEIPEPVWHQVEDSLLNVLSGEDAPTVRRNALESMGYSSRPEVPSLLQEAYQRGNIDWLASSLYAMGRSADDRWSPEVIRMLAHDLSPIREEAARAAGELELRDARADLLRMAREDEEEVQIAAIWSLSQIGGDEVRETLEELLEAAEDDEKGEIIENALDNLTINEGMGLFDNLDIGDIDEDNDEKSGPGLNGNRTSSS
ncbi:MAG: HEAT repeat domain-containing protein [Anaerolineaceae bacterium]|nr:HEAT repeat domain-containing protein [Anaerolineaceae bacterium]